jgi:hypothetical protein
MARIFPAQLAWSRGGEVSHTRAHGRKLDALGDWVIDAWLLAPLDVDDASGVVRLSLEQSLRNVALDLPDWMPRPRNERCTAWYVEREWPVLHCTLTVASAAGRSGRSSSSPGAPASDLSRVARLRPAAHMG